MTRLEDAEIRQVCQQEQVGLPVSEEKESSVLNLINVAQ